MDSEEKKRMPLIIDVGTTSFATAKYTSKDIEETVESKRPLELDQEDTCEVMPQVDPQTGQMRFTFAPLCEVRITNKIWVSPDKINYWFYMDTSIDAESISKIAQEGIARRKEFKEEILKTEKSKTPIQFPGPDGLVDASGNPIKTPPPIPPQGPHGR